MVSSRSASFTLARAGYTTVEVYNVAGQKISTLVNGSLSAGSHSVVWNARNASDGVYFCTVKSGNFSKTMKMTLLKYASLLSVIQKGPAATSGLFDPTGS